MQKMLASAIFAIKNDRGGQAVPHRKTSSCEIVSLLVLALLGVATHLSAIRL